MVFRPSEHDPRTHDSSEKDLLFSREDNRREHEWIQEFERDFSKAPTMTLSSDRIGPLGTRHEDPPHERETKAGPWIAPERGATHLRPINLAPLKGVLESDPMRSKILRVLIEDGGWVTTTDLLKVARQVRPIMGAVTIGTILSGLNELVSARLILSRSSLGSGIDWAEWRINPDWLDPTRHLLQMLTRARIREAQRSESS
ncbi:MAG: hypothetical protein K9W43_02045 [Candidatus Thorarchaeota archaeon]|nr:hypothetical protein [Candidatus Thorarchaeota archaeon]